MPEERKSKSSAGDRSKTIRSDAVECGHIPDKNQPDMVVMMSKLLRKTAAPDVDINIFTGNPVDYHYCSVLWRFMTLGLDWQDWENILVVNQRRWSDIVSSIHIKSWKLTNFITSCWNVKVLHPGKIGILLILQKWCACSCQSYMETLKKSGTGMSWVLNEGIWESQILKT